MIIRAFREQDREALKAITVEAFSGVSIDQNLERLFGPIAGHDWRWRKARQIDDDIAAAGSAILVAEDADGRVAGYITTRIDREAGVGLIPNLAVRSDIRGHGLGRRLIDEALKLFQQAGLTIARIETLDQNAVGQHLYPDCGFVEVARQIHYGRKI